MSTNCDVKSLRELRGKFNGSTWTCPQGCCELQPIWNPTTSSWVLLWTPPGASGFKNAPDDAELTAIARESVATS